MNSSEIAKFEYFLAKSFREGNMLRELRLSDQEIEHLQEKYPRAILQQIKAQDNLDGRVWYEVSFSASKQ